MLVRRSLLVSLVLTVGCGRRSFEIDADGATPSVNVAFVTSTSHIPLTFGADLAGADAICATAATDASLAGTFVAYASSSTVSAIARLDGSRGWVRTDGKPFVDRPEDLASGKLFHPLRIDEHGNDVGTSAPRVATGTAVNGGADVNYTCNDYTAANNDITAGLPYATSEGWASQSITRCNAPARLYCFGLGRNEPLVVTPVDGRRAFVTIQPFSASSGLAGADALCASEASLGGLTGSFRALLTTTPSAISRFSLTGPTWVRLDGIALADSPLTFATGALHTSLNQTVTGTYVGMTTVLTGGGLSSTSLENCSDWTIPTGYGDSGIANRTDTAFFDSTMSMLCSARIYCLEE